MINAILFSCVILAFGDAFIAILRASGGASLHAILGGSLVSFLFTLGFLLLLGPLLSTIITKPSKVAASLWRKNSTASNQPKFTGKVLGSLLGLLISYCLLFVAFRGVLYFFHEPTRMTILASALGIPIVLLGFFSGHLVAERFITPVLLLRPSAAVVIGRLVVLTAWFMLPLSTTAILIFKTAIFGAIDPLPWIVLFWFPALLILFGFLAHRLPSVPFKPKLLPFVAVFVLVAGLFTATIYPPSRGVVRNASASGALAYSLFSRALDMDSDGSPWLLGGDCHPFDAALGPFATEVAGNGLDENCDGLDTVSEEYLGVDPLASLVAPEHLLKPKGNILFVVMDANRADHWSLYGYERDTTPNINRFAKNALVFENCFAVANHTGIAMPSILGGNYPSRFPESNKVDWGSFRIRGPQYERQIHRRLRKAGYYTAMHNGHGMVGFTKGFDELYQPPNKNYANAKQVTQKSLEFLSNQAKKTGSPIFLITHLIDGHHPYKLHGSKQFGPSQMDRYDGEIVFSDDRLGHILKLMESETYKNWMVIITSDHGEAFGEHGTKHHGSVLFNEEISVPLVMRIPGVKPRRISTVVSHTDIVPTILEWAGLGKDSTIPGTSLLGLASRNEEPVAPRTAFAEFFRKGNNFAAFDGRYTMMFHLEENSYELYDTQTDPSQKNNIVDEEKRPALKHLLDDHVANSLKRREAASLELKEIWQSGKE